MLNSLFLWAITVFLTSFLPFPPALYFTSAHTPTTVMELMSSFGFMSSNSFLLHSYFILVQSLTSLKSVIIVSSPSYCTSPSVIQTPHIHICPLCQKTFFHHSKYQNPFNICLWKLFFLNLLRLFVIENCHLALTLWFQVLRLHYNHTYYIHICIFNTKTSSTSPSANISDLTLSDPPWKQKSVEIKSPQILHFLF